MDDADRAQEVDEVHMRRALMAHAYALPRGEAAMECIECGDEIPEDRRQASPGCLRCVGCQSKIERRLKERG